MQQWLKLKWKTKRTYITALLVLFVAGLIELLTNEKFSQSGDLGIWLGGLIACLVWLGPIVYVDVNGIKIAKPKEKFIEPSRNWIVLISFGGAILTAILMFIGVFIGLLALAIAGIEVSYDFEGIIGHTILSFAIFTMMLAPCTVYMLNALLRYQRIVEYMTPEWKRIRK